MRAWIPWLQYPIIAFMAWVGWCLDFEKLPNNKIYSDAIVETQDAAPDLVLWGAIVWVVVKLFSWMCGPKHPSELIIERLATSALDEFRRSVFPSIEDSTEPDHHNRVTLFQHKKLLQFPSPWRSFFWPWGFGCYPWSGWLIAISRSGHVTQNLRSAFYCPDDGESGEGLASKAYFKGACRTSKLPKLSRNESSHILSTWLYRLCRYFKFTGQKCEKFNLFWSKVEVYADMTGTSRFSVWKRVRKKRACPNNMLGIRLENSHNEVWGVLTMDSSNDIVCIDSNSSQFRTALTRLTKKLRNMGVID